MLIRTDDRIMLVALLRASAGPKLAALRQAIIEGVDLRRLVAQLTDPEAALQQAESDMMSWAEHGHRLLTFFDDDYPTQFRDVHDFPPVIFVRGTIRTGDRGVSVVGSRDADSREVSAAAEIAHLLVDAGLTVVSGLARGIDAAAHAAALAAGGRTVGVLGSGIDQYTPKSSAPIQRRMEEEGLVLSQFWPGFTGNQQSFPMRNATMSAYSQATLILAAGEKSGTRHQARQALAHGRPLILSASVATGTSWGRDLSQRHARVAVVSSPGEAVEQALRMTVPARIPTLA